MKIRVGTYYHPRDGVAPKLSHIMAYTRWYSPTWATCIEYDIEATGGAEAKRLAREKRLVAERLHSQDGGPESVHSATKSNP